MPRRTVEGGIEPFEVRAGLGFQRFRGMNRSADPGNIPLDQFHLQVNIRLTPAGMVDRPGAKEEYDSGVSECITGMLETGEPQPSAALWSYNDYYFRTESFPATGPLFQGFYAAIDNDLPLNVPASPLGVIAPDPLETVAANANDLPGKIEIELGSLMINSRVQGAFLFQGKVCELKDEVLSQITDIKFELDENDTTGKLQEIFPEITDGGGDVVIRQEFDGSEVRDVLYTPSSNAGEIVRFDGVTVTAISTGGTVIFQTMALVNGQGLAAIGDDEIAYQADPDAAWTITAHTYENVHDAAGWGGSVYFIGEVLANDGTEIVRFIPATGGVSVVQASTTGTLKDESFWRLTPTKQGLLYFRIEETDGPATLFDIGRITGTTSSDPTWLNIGFMQDFSPARLAYIVEIGSRIFYSVDATEEFNWPSPGKPSYIFGFDFAGAIFEILSGPSVGYFYVEYGDDDPGSPGLQTGCPVAAMPIGPGDFS